MGSQAANGHLGNVCEGLTDGASKDETADLLVQGGHVGILDEGIGPLLQVVDAEELSDYDL